MASFRTQRKSQSPSRDLAVSAGSSPTPSISHARLRFCPQTHLLDFCSLCLLCLFAKQAHGFLCDLCSALTPYQPFLDHLV